ncbi:MAG: hypothetical protein FWG71_05750 [Synergistaceae bacterium]|nr:hypothetical protein [Synergistaceae bacterium]
MKCIMKCLCLFLFAVTVSAVVPARAAETAVTQPGFFAAERQGDFIQARDYAVSGALQYLQGMYDQERIFALPMNVTVEITTFDSQTLTCRIGIPQSGIYYWTDIEAVKPGYRNHATASEVDERPKTEEEKNQEAVEKWNRWFMAQPLINADRVAAMKKHDIDNMDIVDRPGGIMEDARSRGFGVDLAGTGNATVVIGVSERVLGHVDYSQIPVDFAKDRSWTACLYTSNGQLAKKETTTGDIIAFQIVAGQNDQGVWRVQLEDVRGYLDQQVVFVMVVNKPIKLLGQ